MTAANKLTMRELVEDFLYKEAVLLDDWRLDDWVSLFTEMITGFDLRVDAGAVSRYWIWSPGDA